MTNQDLHLTNTNKKVPPRTYGVYGDTGRQLSMYLDDYTLAAGDTAAVYVHRADGSFYSIAATVDTVDQVVTVDMTQMLTCVGLVQCNLNIENSGLGVQSYNFITVCEESASGSPSTKQNGQSVLDLMNEVQKLKAGLITDTRSGNPVYMADGYDGMEVKALKVGIVPAQAGSGTPTPSNPRTISGITSATITRYGANLLDPDKCTAVGYIAAFGITVEQVGDAFHVYGTSTVTNAYAGFAVFRYSDYSLSGKSYVVQTWPVSGSTTIKTTYGFRTTSEKEAAVVIELVSGQSYDFTFRFSVCVNSQTEFNAFSEKTYTQPLGGTVYGGSADFVTGEITDEAGIIDLGDLTYTYQSAFLRFYASVPGAKPCANGSVAPFLASDIYDPSTFNSVTGANYRIAIDDLGRVFIRNEDYSDKDVFKAAMAGHKMTFELATKTTGTQDPADQVTTVKGPNTMFSNSGDIDVEYYADTKIYIANH